MGKLLLKLVLLDRTIQLKNLWEYTHTVRFNTYLIFVLTQDLTAKYIFCSLFSESNECEFISPFLPLSLFSYFFHYLLSRNRIVSLEIQYSQERTLYDHRKNRMALKVSFQLHIVRSQWTDHLRFTDFLLLSFPHRTTSHSLQCFPLPSSTLNKNLYETVQLSFPPKPLEQIHLVTYKIDSLVH